MFTIVKQHPLVNREKQAVAFLENVRSSVREASIIEALNFDHLWEQKGVTAFAQWPVIIGPYSLLWTPFNEPLPEYRFMLRLRDACVMVKNRNGVLPFLRGLHIQQLAKQEFANGSGFKEVLAREHYGQLDDGPSETPALQQLYRDWGVEIVWWP